VFGRAFPLLDISHRLSTPLINKWQVERLPPQHEIRKYAKPEGLLVPLSFRVVATMNSYDRTLLFKLGYALQRRFALVPWSEQTVPLPPSPQSRVTDVEEWASDDLVKRSLDQAGREMTLPGIVEADSVLLDPKRIEQLDGVREALKQPDDRLNGTSPFDFAFGMLGYLGEALEKVESEQIGIQIAQCVDIARFLLASRLVDEQVHPLLAIDEAIASYVVPQLDVLGRYVRAARLGLQQGPGEEATKQLSMFSEYAEKAGLVRRTVPAIRRILSGQSAI